MPWFPDFVGAIELAKQQTRSRGQADPVAEYFGALQSGARPRPGNGVAGRRGDLKPGAGEVRGHHQLGSSSGRINRGWLGFTRPSRRWLQPHVGPCRRRAPGASGGLRREGRGMAHRRGRRVAGRVLSAVPHLLQPMAGRRETASATAHTQERGGPSPVTVTSWPAIWPHWRWETLKRLSGTFGPDGYVREPIGPRATHRGIPELRTYSAGCFGGGGGIHMEHCCVTDDGTRCGLEFNLRALGRP